MLAQPFEQRVVDVEMRQRHAVRVLERHAFDFIEDVRKRRLHDGEQFFPRDLQLAADGSVDVLSKRTAIVRGDAPVEECAQRGREEARTIDAAPHAADGPKNRRAPRVDEVCD